MITHINVEQWNYQLYFGQASSRAFFSCFTFIFLWFWCFSCLYIFYDVACIWTEIGMNSVAGSNKEQAFRWSDRGPGFILLVFKFYNKEWRRTETERMVGKHYPLFAGCIFQVYHLLCFELCYLIWSLLPFWRW